MKHENDDTRLTKLINWNYKTLKLNINGSKLKLWHLKPKNNDMWLTKLIK